MKITVSLQQASLAYPTINIQNQCGTFFTIDEPIMVYYC